ncbi:hypothetical protein [Marinilabilia rubra]|uniref:Uncharacterized protein n=1 Tax=Marinilabilia rubra TaxID=2162893 RepID=A0A2U2B908_9BACT|nr:hypothetical protein [Marinilabilia rubra]PWD99547.1 hypothetical protein DDZ16_08815 [Marinilabilia rubra]
MQILIIVLSAILLILIVALIFKKDFRADVIKPGDNSGEVKGLKVKGTLFWVVYALTAVGTFYLALEFDKNNRNNCSPVLRAEAENWVAMDLDRAEPTDLIYGCDSLTEHKIFSSTPKLKLELSVDSQYAVSALNSQFQLGKIETSSLRKLLNCKKLSFESYIEVFFNLNIEEQSIDTVKNQPTLYDWYAYQKLPFTINPRILGEGMVEVFIRGKKQEISDLKIGPLSLGDKWEKTIFYKNKAYIVRLRSRDIYTNNDFKEHANFQIFKLGLKPR